MDISAMQKNEKDTSLFRRKRYNFIHFPGAVSIH